jgi:predicted nucleic acid-binding protein
MKVLFDTSALVASIWAEHPRHERAKEWLLKVRRGEATGVVSQHTLLEAYASLTGMPSRPKLGPAIVRAALLEALQGFEVSEMSPSDYWDCLARAELSGLSGGVVYDLLILTAGETAVVDCVLTANEKDFKRLASTLRIEPL